ncbi:STAS domain-containing protein [Stratiformator vulcanicus]|uniref:STAS domain-containing protein n=1 Tax=Stratiformator vulcanicus TaxID=2527980 RepID=A0A517QZE5_9PLAN|nr:STAS domain-containing protein [Stratiformator vulcanicus]QDT37012.1 hypothetical protein Pan189_13780 [Stratiformator vulcanicus]
MKTAQETFDVYQSGELCVIGFGDRDPLDISVPDCQDELNRLIEKTGGKALAVDMTGLKLIASGMLGLLASLNRDGVRVMLFNPSEDILEVLDITNLNQLISTHTVEV